MNCCYGIPECTNNEEGKCLIITCYDEYDMREGKPFPNNEVKAYWTKLLRRPAYWLGI